MARKAKLKPARKQKRLSPDDRRREFVAKATEFFAEQGFGGGTRDLARRLGVTQPLLYRYFPSKDDLIREVYRTVYLEPLDTGWEKLLTDRSRPIRQRLREFYDAYTNVIFSRKWLRIYLYSGLKGLDINRRYVAVVQDKILTPIIRECRHEAGLPAQNKPTAAELEMAWVFHSGIFYYGVRKYIYESPVLEDKQQMIADALDVFLAGFEGIFGSVAACSPLPEGKGRSRSAAQASGEGSVHTLGLADKPLTRIASSSSRSRLVPKLHELSKYNDHNK
jgi:AcrR family transcriptional regulator